MTDTNEMCATIMRELNNLVISDTDEGETKEEQKSFSFHEEEASDEIPQSLLSYFETSKSRAAVCEKLILEELEDLTASHHTEDMRRGDLPAALDEVTCGTENAENNTFTDTRLLPAPTESEALFTHNVSVCHNKEDEAGTDEYTECEQHLALDTRTLEISLNDEERKKSDEYEVERERQHREEMKKEERRRQREKDFQEELKKIMEAEKLHQKELELKGKRAQEKLEQELLIQQELISNLQRRVAEERKIKEEEWKRMKEEKEKKKKEEEERSKREEENRRKWEELKSKAEAERKRMEEEMRRMREEAEKRKIEEIRLKEEEERRKKQEEWEKREEEEKRRIEKEENKKKEEERHKIELEKKKLEDEMRRMKEEEERNKRIKKEEEERKKVEVARKKFEEEKNGKMEEEMRLKKEEEWRKKEKEEQKRREEKNVRIEKEVMKKEVEERKKQEEMRKEKEEDDRKKIEAERKTYEEMRKTGEKEHGNKDEEMRLEERMKKTEKERKTREEEEERKSEKINMMEEKEKEEEVRGKEEEDRKLEEEKRTKEEDEKRKKKDERRAKKEERRRRQEEEMRRQREEDDYRKTQEEIRLTEEKDEKKGYEAENRQMEPDRKNKYEEKKQEEEGMRKMEDGRINIEAERRQIEEEVRKNKEENLKTEGRRLKDEDDITKFIIQDEEKTEKLIRVNELQEKKRENKSRKTENERENTDNTGNSQTSSSPAPLHSESTVSPTITESVQQHDLDISQSSVCKTTGQEDPVIRPSTSSSSSGSLLLCLPEHTEQKRLSWMKDCIPWSKLSLQNRRKQRGCVRSWRGPRRVAEASSLPPLSPDTLLQSTGWKSLKEVTTVTLEDLLGCSLSTVVRCRQLRSLTLRRCGLKALEGINQLPELCYIDVQENDISFVDCENMTSLQVLRLGHNTLMSIHGLSGADNLAVLDLSHNSITRIAGLESLRRLQRLSVDHNQLISTKGLRDVYTLLHLDCSHNHLVNVEGLENSALLNTLDLTANSLAEPPSLNNQVLLRELHLDDNSISSLQGLTACWLPLMQILSVAQNRITQLPSMSDFVSLASIDLRFNCLSELRNVCESLEGCQFLQEVHLVGNPLEQESGWRSAMQKAVPGLRAIDGQETHSFLSPLAVQQVSLASGSFLTFCQAQLQQTRDLQRQHNEELSNASFSLDSVKTCCRHFTEALRLAEDQRFAHEYGDTTAADKQRGSGQTTPDEALDEESSSAGKLNERPGMEFTGKVSPLIPREDSIRTSYRTFEENLATDSWHGALDTVTAGPDVKSAVFKVNSGSFHSFTTKREMTSASLKKAAVSNHQDLDLKNTAAVVIQQQWRKYRQKCGNIISPPTAEKGGGKGGDGGTPESRPSCIKWNVVGQDHAATVIQAFWRGFTLRRRLTSALAAVTCPHTREDDTFEEVDMDEFVFDEAALEKDWTLPLSEDSPPRCDHVSEQSQKPLGSSPEPSQYKLPPPPVWRPKQAWMAGEQVDSAGQRVSPESFDRSKSPASTSVLSGLSKRSEKILEEWGFTDSHTALLMLKRAEKMKSKKQQQKKHLDPSIRLALFRNCTYQLDPVEARNRPPPRNRNYIKVREVELGLQQAEKTEQVKEEWMRTQAAQSDRDSESEHFLPEISSDILNGGRVQLVAEPGYTELLHHASGLWANSSLAARPCKENNYPRRNSLGHAKKEVPSPKRVTSAPPSKKERISFRDHPVQLSGGWGGGKKRDKVHK
ncbi:leucine-rich repeat and IQ domain-containing protein 1 [Thunnus thynnus]|uniref:leucine-rich repeat and IQ domain-containing protein 1 n=1 Tax=Thunnus thynnus TaxID=8237 RepID=UPI003528ADE6